MVDCQQLFELNNRLSENVLYIGNRPLYLVYFELIFNNIIRKDQHDLVFNNGIIQDIDSVEKPKNIFEMLMGKGKTSVIGPLLVYHYIFSRAMKQILMVMPTTLVKQSNAIFVKYAKLLEFIGYTICKDKRESNIVSQCIDFNPNKRQLLIMDSGTIQSFLLNNVEASIGMKDGKSQRQRLQEKLEDERKSLEGLKEEKLQVEREQLGGGTGLTGSR